MGPILSHYSVPHTQIPGHTNGIFLLFSLKNLNPTTLWFVAMSTFSWFHMLWTIHMHRLSLHTISNYIVNKIMPAKASFRALSEYEPLAFHQPLLQPTLNRCYFQAAGDLESLSWSDLSQCHPHLHWDYIQIEFLHLMSRKDDTYIIISERERDF